MARYNLQIAVGTYTGNGADNRNITGVGFRPQLAIVKQPTNNGVFRTRLMGADSTGFLTSTNSGLTDRIQGFTDDGFQVGAAAQVNSNGLVYHYLAIMGTDAQAFFKTGRYLGTGSDNRTISNAEFVNTPDLVVLQVGSQNAVWRSSSMAGDLTASFTNASSAADKVQSLVSGGFTVGTHAQANNSGQFVDYFALKSDSRFLKVGSFTGDGAASKAITGVGFRPDVVVVKNSSSTAISVLFTSTMASATINSMFMGTGGTIADGILSLDSDGFTVGANSAVNGSGNTIEYFALKAGDYNVPIVRDAV